MLLLVSGVFVQRGVVRGVTGSHDLTMMYAGARQWVQGGNPYPLDGAYDAYVEGGGGAERPRDPKWFAQLYPPTTYAVMGPVGVLPWPVARAVFCGLNLVGWALAGWWAWGALGRPAFGGLRLRHPHPESPTPNPAAGFGGLVLTAAFLVWAPVHTTLAFGQLGGVVVGLVCVGLGGMTGWRAAPMGRGVVGPALRGLAMAVACCLKPQLAGLLVVALGVWGWGRRGQAHGVRGVLGLRTVGWCVGWGLLISAVAAGRLMVTAPTWWGDLRANVSAFAGTGFADPSRANGHAWQMINLEPWLRHVGVGEAAAGVLPWVLGMGALIVVGIAGARARSAAVDEAGLNPHPESPIANPGDEVALLHLLATAAVVSLLVVYHRSYDAVLLVFPAVWAWRRVSAGGWRGAGGVAAGLVVVMGLPLPAVLSVAVERGWLPAGLVEAGWWAPGVLMHQNVALVLLLGVLVVGGVGARQEERLG